MKKLDLKEEISKHYKWALENPTILTVSALQEEWIRWVEDEILPKWNTNLDALKTDRMAFVEKVKTLANFLEETRKIGRYPDKRSSDEVYDRIVEAIGKADVIWKELESKSKMR